MLTAAWPAQDHHTQHHLLEIKSIIPEVLSTDPGECPQKVVLRFEIMGITL
jgi:hypothetical protein